MFRLTNLSLNKLNFFTFFHENNIRSISFALLCASNDMPLILELLWTTSTFYRFKGFSSTDDSDDESALPLLISAQEEAVYRLALCATYGFQRLATGFSSIDDSDEYCSLSLSRVVYLRGLLFIAVSFGFGSITFLGAAITSFLYATCISLRSRFFSS